jgi:hypothetical protein
MTRTYDSPEEAEWATPRRTGHPRGCFTEPVRLLQPLESYDFTRTYIKATLPPRGEQGSSEAFWDAASHARNSALWRYAEVETNHMVPNNKPEELTQLLLELA